MGVLLLLPLGVEIPPVLLEEDERVERYQASPCQGRWIFAVGKKKEG